MKARKNKKRFDPRWHHSERTEDSKEQQTLNEGNIKVNFNSFNLDTWLEEDKGKLFPGGTIADLPAEDPPERRSKRRMTPEEKAKADQRLRNRKPGETVYASELEEQEEVAEGGCGGPEMGPEEPQAVPPDLSSDDTFDAGYTAAVEEIMASIQGLLEDPMDMSVGPEEEESALVVTQLPEAEEHEDGRSTDLIKTLEKEWNKSMNKVKSSSVDNDADYLLNVIRGVGDLGAGREIPVADYIESLDEEDIDALIDRLQDEKETLKSQKPHVYELIMAIISKRASAPRSRDGEAEDRTMDFRDDAIGDYPR